MSKCLYCKSESLRSFDEVDVIKYKGADLNVSLLYSVCGNCGEEVVTKEQILVNDARVRDAQKSFDGLMTSKEIREARAALGLTQEEASKIFGGGKNAFSKYERAEVSQSVAMDKLIRVALKHRDIFYELAESENIKITEKPSEAGRVFRSSIKLLKAPHVKEEILNTISVSGTFIESIKSVTSMYKIFYHTFEKNSAESFKKSQLLEEFYKQYVVRECANDDSCDVFGKAENYRVKKVDFGPQKATNLETERYG